MKCERQSLSLNRRIIIWYVTISSYATREAATDLHRVVTGKDAPFLLEAFEPCELWVISKTDMDRAMATSRAMETFTRLSRLYCRVNAWKRLRALRLVVPHKSLISHFNKAIMAIMKKASITEAKNNLSALIDGVKAGSSVLIVDRGRPVARLEPASGLAVAGDDRLARLIRDGIVRPAHRAVSKSLFAAKPPRAKPGASGVRTLLDERREGR